MVTDLTIEQAAEAREESISKIQKIIDLKLVDEGDCVVRDTLANLMHWCDLYDINFESELRVGRDFHDMEKDVNHDGKTVG